MWRLPESRPGRTLHSGSSRRRVDQILCPDIVIVRCEFESVCPFPPDLQQIIHLGPDYKWVFVNIPNVGRYELYLWDSIRPTLRIWTRRINGVFRLVNRVVVPLWSRLTKKSDYALICFVVIIAAPKIHVDVKFVIA